MVKNNKSSPPANQLTAHDQYWNQIDQHAHYLVADLLNHSLPLPNLRDKKNLDLTQDADYRTLFWEYENNYSEEPNLPTSKVLAEQIAYEYLLLVVKSLLKSLGSFSCHLDFEGLIE